MTGPADLASLAHHFLVVIDQGAYDLGSWASASGLAVTWGLCEYRAGDTGNAVWVHPGTTRYPNVKLSRAACADSETVQRWLAATSNGETPLSGSVQLVDWTNRPIVQWTLKRFFPVGWSIGEFSAIGQSRVVLETLEIVHTGFLADETTGGAR
ncbi:phage tail protein [Amycolatopsis sp. cg5]|uniref:phage tail protein n=1 Tax=Amycolatopsis sp. cg5 TaxID=3238802 RepID=UPI0035260F27